MSVVHIYAAGEIPLTADYLLDGEIRIPGMKPRALAICHRCRRRRRAENLVAQHYYDNTYVWCASAENCKRPKRSAKR